MTIQDFMQIHGIKKKEKVLLWIKKGLIPKADIGSDYIPNSARIPYTKARAKTVQAIYYSMIQAAINLKHIVPSLYKIGQDEFNGYISQLVEAGFIKVRISDEIPYYDATLAAANYNKKLIFDTIERLAKGTAEGITTVILNHQGE